MEIRQALDTDAAELARIFNHTIETSTASWWAEPVSVSQREEWLDTHVAFVAVEGGEILGFAGFAQWQENSGFRYTAEDSIFLDPKAVGRGIGSELLRTVITEARARGFRKMVAAIDSQNEASIALHTKFGFEQVGLLPAVGRKWEQDLDLTLWLLAL
ncbi:GNAT family N-acetyltransferase [Corynebacterium hindlerae]|uniref:GNAT family N-acetyltransferase n=1 Tax=Corynebacterium hindlerae TaxID=699041 RepID=UPI0031B6E1F2